MQNNWTIAFLIFSSLIFFNCSNKTTDEKNPEQIDSIGKPTIMDKSNCLKSNYPHFYKKSDEIKLEQVIAGLSKQTIDSIELKLNTKLPNSYKKFLKCCCGFEAFGGIVKFYEPFIHKFEPYDQINTQAKKYIKREHWPPPSEGMICFADFFMLADGDQVLFDTKKGLINGEYPVYYYDHESHPARVWKIADSFEQWLVEFPNYKELYVEE